MAKMQQSFSKKFKKLVVFFRDQRLKANLDAPSKADFTKVLVKIVEAYVGPDFAINKDQISENLAIARVAEEAAKEVVAQAIRAEKEAKRLRINEEKAARIKAVKEAENKMLDTFFFKLPISFCNLKTRPHRLAYYPSSISAAASFITCSCI